MITDFNNEIRVVENTDLIVESSTKEEEYVNKDKALRKIVKFEKDCEQIEVYTTSALVGNDNEVSVVVSNRITLNLTRLTSNKDANSRSLSVSIVSCVVGTYNGIVKNRNIIHEKICNPATEGCFVTSWKFNDDIIYSMYNVKMEEDGTCKIPEELVKLMSDPDQLFLTDESIINLINETFVEDRSEEYKRYLKYFAERNHIDEGLLHYMVKDFENIKNDILESGHSLTVNPCQQLKMIIWYEGKAQELIVGYHLSQDLFKLVKYYKDSIAETYDNCDIGVNRIDRMVNYHFTIRKKE